MESIPSTGWLNWLLETGLLRLPLLAIEPITDGERIGTDWLPSITVLFLCLVAATLIVFSLSFVDRLID